MRVRRLQSAEKRPARERKALLTLGRAVEVRPALLGPPAPNFWLRQTSVRVRRLQVPEPGRLDIASVPDPQPVLASV